MFHHNNCPLVLRRVLCDCYFSVRQPGFSQCRRAPSLVAALCCYALGALRLLHFGHKVRKSDYYNIKIVILLRTANVEEPTASFFISQPRDFSKDPSKQLTFAECVA